MRGSQSARQSTPGPRAAPGDGIPLDGSGSRRRSPRHEAASLQVVVTDLPGLSGVFVPVALTMPKYYKPAISVAAILKVCNMTKVRAIGFDFCRFDRHDEGANGAVRCQSR